MGCMGCHASNNFSIQSQSLFNKLGPDPALNVHCFCFWKILDRAVTYCFITPKVGTDFPLNLLHIFIVEGNMVKGGCGYSPTFSIVGSKFTNITKKWNDFSFNNELVISRVFSWKSYGKSINFFNNELIFFHPGINNSLMMAITAFEKTTIIIFQNCKSPSSIIIKFLLLNF